MALLSLVGGGDGVGEDDAGVGGDVTDGFAVNEVGLIDAAIVGTEGQDDVAVEVIEKGAEEQAGVGGESFGQDVVGIGSDLRAEAFGEERVVAVFAVFRSEEHTSELQSQF